MLFRIDLFPEVAKSHEVIPGDIIFIRLYLNVILEELLTNKSEKTGIFINAYGTNVKE
jgi:hypothetical protein